MHIDEDTASTSDAIIVGLTIAAALIVAWLLF